MPFVIPTVVIAGLLYSCRRLSKFIRRPTTLTLASLTRIAKNYALDSSESEESFLNALLEPYIWAGRVKARKGADFKLDKSRTSRILNGKADVPIPLKKPLARMGIESKTANAFPQFIDDHFDMDCFEQFASDISSVIDEGNKAGGALRHQLDSLAKEPSAYFAHCLIAALKETNISTSSVTAWQNGTGSFSLEAGDLLGKGFGKARRVKNIVVIPVNTSFDTEVSWAYEGADDPLVSEKSIHGQWLVRMYGCGEDAASLHSRISKDLEAREVSSSGINDKGGAKYPIGTVSIMENNKAVFFLLAVAEFDCRNKASSDPQHVRKAIESLLCVYDERGQGLDMYLPLLGTGMSRAQLSHVDSYKLIESTIRENADRVHGKVTLMVLPADMHKLNIDF